MKLFIHLSPLLVAAIFLPSKLTACGFIQEWPNPETLKLYGLSDTQIARIKGSLDTLLKVKDSLTKEKEREYENLTKLMEAEEIDEIKIRRASEKIEKLRAGILRNDISFLLRMRKTLPPKLYKKIKRLFKLGDPHKWKESLEEKEEK